jgi:hypothetical protein
MKPNILKWPFRVTDIQKLTFRLCELCELCVKRFSLAEFAEGPYVKSLISLNGFSVSSKSGR